MYEEKEIEYKAILTKEQFKKLQSLYPFPKNPIKQTNYYFETNQFDLKNHHAALRIRMKNNEYILTLKQAKEGYALENHVKLNQASFENWVNNHITFPETFRPIMEELNIEEKQLFYQGFLKTNRYTFEKDHVHFCLDESHYFNEIDYELEIEESEKHLAKDIFINIMEELKIEQPKSITKIERFYNSLHKK